MSTKYKFIDKQGVCLTRVFGVNDYESSSDVGATGRETCAYVEIKYLRDKGIKNISLKDGTTLDLDNIDLNGLN